MLDTAQAIKHTEADVRSPERQVSSSPVVAIIEDDPNQRCMYGMFMDCLSPDTLHTEFVCGEDFILAVTQNGFRPTHVVCDYNMLELNGLETLKQLIQFVKTVPGLEMPRLVLFTSRDLESSHIDRILGEDRNLVIIKQKIVDGREYVRMALGEEEP